MTPIYYIKNGNLSFADKIILLNLELYLYKGDKICLVGRNGCGKSSLMKVISGAYELDQGEVFKDPAANIGYLTQDVTNNLNISIYDFITKKTLDKKIDNYKIDMVLEKLEINGSDNLSTYSGGQIRRACLAKALISEPEILLLDEPTNHLDIGTIEWLEEFVKSYNGAIICVSHDRTFLSNVTNKIWWLDRSVLRKSDKGFKYFDEWQAVIVEQEEARLRKLNKKLEQENDWLNAGVTARRKRNQKRLAELRALREIAREHAEKLYSSRQKIQAELAENIAKSKFIIEVDSVSFGYNGNKIIDNFSFRVKKGEKIGVIGANGSGKSTFIKLLTKQLSPNVGKVIYGGNLDISYFDQHREKLNPNHTLQQTLCPTGGDQVFLPGKTMHVAGYLKQFMFDPKLLKAKTSILSGGEANRLLLARILINPGNLLILDEPTNDLDMDSLEILLDILADYSGTLIVVSHDRDFLDKLATRTLVFAQGKIIDLTGGYEDYKQYFSAPPLIKKPTKLPSQAPLLKESPNKKLSYKYQRLLETLPLEIEKLELQIKNLETELYDSNLYLANPTKYSLITNKLSLYKQQRDKLLNEWLEIQE
ncbi:ABC-F family ATP-binding cassette domain-containing protein [Rickettsia endosymbiont of Halotydeus destructor]|uniref:ABC-F family ATP-binding cassette domain-containing protein n=1 Tax=Rickettsia endosymbiont of Halotydeus destructor TaxID=2996754 RepID=UPI003BB0EFA6